MVRAVNLKLLSKGDMVQRLGLPMGKLRLVMAMVRGLCGTAWVRESMSGCKAQARDSGSHPRENCITTFLNCLQPGAKKMLGKGHPMNAPTPKALQDSSVKKDYCSPVL